MIFFFFLRFLCGERFTFGILFFFSKKKNIYSPIVQKSSGLKLALMYIFPHSPAGVAISGISLH